MESSWRVTHCSPVCCTEQAALSTTPALRRFFFSYVAVSLCSSYLLQYGYVHCRRCFSPWGGKHGYTTIHGNSPVSAAQLILATRDPRDKLRTHRVDRGVLQVSITNQPRQLVRPALLLLPAYFCLNYTYFLSLDLTAVSNTMVLSASTGIWTLLFSRLLLNVRLHAPAPARALAPACPIATRLS